MSEHLKSLSLKGQCRIATDTPEKMAIEQEEREKKSKADEKTTRAAAREAKRQEAAKRKATPTSSHPGSKL